VLKSSSTSPQLVIEVRPDPRKDDYKGFDFASVLPALVGGLIVILGWRVVEHYARKRERRTDLRESLKILEATVDDIVEVATKFYQITGKNPDAPTLATLIKSKIQSLNPLILLISDSGVTVDATEELKLFRQAVTGGNFESASRGASPAKSAKYVKMEAAGQNLVQAIRLATFKTLIIRTKQA